MADIVGQRPGLVVGVLTVVVKGSGRGDIVLVRACFAHRAARALASAALPVSSSAGVGGAHSGW